MNYIEQLKQRLPELERRLGSVFSYGKGKRTHLASIAHSDDDAERNLGDIDLDLSEARPIGEDYFGNLILMSTEDGAIVLWDVHLVEVFDVAESLDQFIDSLTSED